MVFIMWGRSDGEQNKWCDFPIQAIKKLGVLIGRASQPDTYLRIGCFCELDVLPTALIVMGCSTCIVDNGQAHPSSNRDTIFQDVDLLRLFKWAAERGVNFNTSPIENVIRDSWSKVGPR